MLLSQARAHPLRSLRHVVSSGEKLFTSTADAFVRAPGVRAALWNMYGATEAGCAYFCIRSGEAGRLRAFGEGVPAGVPQAYVDVFVMAENAPTVPPSMQVLTTAPSCCMPPSVPPSGALARSDAAAAAAPASTATAGAGARPASDAKQPCPDQPAPSPLPPPPPAAAAAAPPSAPAAEPLRPVPSGEPGEICFGGGGEGFMARGYWRNAALTADRFVHSATYGRLYRTGDVGRWEGGQLLVAGRLDRQVKVRPDAIAC